MPVTLRICGSWNQNSWDTFQMSLQIVKTSSEYSKLIQKSCLPLVKHWIVWKLLATMWPALAKQGLSPQEDVSHLHFTLCIQPDITLTIQLFMQCIHECSFCNSSINVIEREFNSFWIWMPWLYWLKKACTVDSYLMRNLSLRLVHCFARAGHICKPKYTRSSKHVPHLF